MLDFDDSSFIREYDSFIPPVFRENNTPSATEEPEDPIVVDYIPEIEYNSEGEAYDIIYVSSDESSHEDAEEEWQDEQETPSPREDVVVISSDEEDEPCPSVLSMKRKRKAYTSPIIHRRRVSSPRRRFPRQYQRKAKIPVVWPDNDYFLETLYCEICRVKLLPAKSGYPLQEKCTQQSKLLCTGCARLLNLTRSKQEFNDMIQYFLTGKLPSYDLPPTLSNDEISSKLELRQIHMKRRCQRKSGDGSHVVTVEELIDLCDAKKGRCVITGWTCFLHDSRRDRMPYWALSLDHIIPVSHIYRRPEAWSISNLQIMCSAMNTVKGNYTDEDVKGWYRQFLNSQVIALD